jgi:hypothetical protein
MRIRTERVIEIDPATRRDVSFVVLDRARSLIRASADPTLLRDHDLDHGHDAAAFASSNNFTSNAGSSPTADPAIPWRSP